MKITRCDRCGKDATGDHEITDPGVRNTTLDVCQKCWEEYKMFIQPLQPSTGIPTSRK
jgi:ribosome-binding protein aMBF1 (putative translation factor)